MTMARELGWEPRPPFAEETYANSPGFSLVFRPVGKKWRGLAHGSTGLVISEPLTWTGMRNWLTECGVDILRIHGWSPMGTLTSPFDVFGGYGTGRPVEAVPASRVYFIQCGDSGPIKIGIARDVRKRMASLQTACPFTLRLLATTEGGADLERELHVRFAEYRLRGEWFLPAAEVFATIEAAA